MARQVEEYQGAVHRVAVHLVEKELPAESAAPQAGQGLQVGSSTRLEVLPEGII